MSDQEETNERRIIEIQSSAVLIRDESDKNPIISDIISSALTIAQRSNISLNDAERIFQEAKRLYNTTGSKQNASRKEAFALFEEASMKDHAEARYFIGCFYNYGIIVNTDLAEAVFYYRGASELNHHLALDVLGTHIFARGAAYHEEAAGYYLRAAELGDYIAQANIAALYESGYGVDMSWEVAKGWYEKAALQGHWESAYRLGNHYISSIGEGISEENSIAFNWLLQAAKLGHNYAIERVAIAYFNGIGTEKDKRETYKWARTSQDLLNSDQFPTYTKEMKKFLDVIKKSMNQKEIKEADQYASEFIEDFAAKKFIGIENDDQPEYRFKKRISS